MNSFYFILQIIPVTGDFGKEVYFSLVLVSGRGLELETGCTTFCLIFKFKNAFVQKSYNLEEATCCRKNFELDLILKNIALLKTRFTNEKKIIILLVE